MIAALQYPEKNLHLLHHGDMLERGKPTIVVALDGCQA